MSRHQLETPGPERRSFQSRAIRVLVVDDQAEDRALTSIKLASIKQPEIELLGASSLKEALRALDVSEVDVCLTDYDLGRGETALDLFRAARNHLHLMPFVAVTGVMDEETLAHKLLIEGFDDVLLKANLEAANLYRVVRNAWLRNAHTRGLVESSTFDDLTGALNRRGMMLRLDLECLKALRLKSLVTVLYVDMNGFKAINDRFGHIAGDEALIHMTRTLESLTRRTDAVARLGGDEFVVVLPGMTRDFGRLMMARITSTLATSPFHFSSNTIFLSAAAGMSLFDPQAEFLSARELLIQADAEMFINKRERPLMEQTIHMY